jgi:AcrR family transcriptional regulator
VEVRTSPGGGVRARRRPGAGRQPAAVAERTREQILEAALATFAARGFAATSLRDIAVAAGTTHGLIRHYFGAKEDVWRAAVDRAVARFADAVTPYAMAAPAAGDAAASHSSVAPGAVLPGAVTPGAAAHGVVAHAAQGLGEFLRVAAQHPEVLRLLVHESEAGGPRLEYVLGRFRPTGERMAPLFARLQAAGALRAFPDNQAFFLTFLMAGALPFALPALAAALGTDLRHEAEARVHATRVIAALLGPMDVVAPG